MAGRSRTVAASVASCLSAAVLIADAGSAQARPSCAGKPATIVGTNGRDVIKTPPRGKSVVHARGGADRIVSRGRDRICGGPGRDRLLGGSGRDGLFGGRGKDFLLGGLGADKLEGGPGNDVVFGGLAGDWMVGGSGRDALYGGLHDDKLRGHSGPDRLDGGHGTDVLRGGPGGDRLRGEIGKDTYLGGPGQDLATFTTATAPSPHDSGGVFIDLPEREVRGDEPDELIHGVENLVGSTFGDSLVGFGGYGGQYGGTGFVVGAGVSDTCHGFARTWCSDATGAGAAPKVFVGAPSIDPGVAIHGGEGPDRWSISTSRGRVRIGSSTPLAAGRGCTRTGPGRIVCKPRRIGYVVAWGGSGNDRITFNGRAPRTATVKLDGGGNLDVIRGGAGDEILLGGEWARFGPRGRIDLVMGRSGNDVLIAAEHGNFSVLRGGRGADQLVGEWICSGGIFDGGPGGPDIAGFAHRFGAIRARLGGYAREFFSKTCGRVRIKLSNEVLEGTQGPDVLIGSPGHDPLILGGKGDDVIRGLGGSDRLRGGPGQDWLFGGEGRDVLEASDGERDHLIECGPGGRRAHSDGRDPPPRGC